MIIQDCNASEYQYDPYSYSDDVMKYTGQRPLDMHEHFPNAQWYSSTESSHEMGNCDFSGQQCHGEILEERSVANCRERKRMSQINSAFEELRSCIPKFPYENRLAKIDILHLAMSYIGFLECLLLTGKSPNELVSQLMQIQNLNATAPFSWCNSDFFARLCWIDWARLGIDPRLVPSCQVAVPKY
uniref:BHLH domain-containing protein n=1 Tax=Trichuris muris TaxID=70415 RepID=A0A5S6QEX9_TRIMR